MRVFILLLLWVLPSALFAQNSYLLVPDAVFDGLTLRANVVVLVQGNTIQYVGEAAKAPRTASTQEVRLGGLTLMPGMIEAHSHVLLHPYDETNWNDQVLKESETVRVVRAVNHLRKTLEAGFTTIRDLGTEGAGYADVGLKQAAQQGLIPSPRMIVTTKAIIATGSYAPRRTDFAADVPQGAEEADGNDLVRVLRDQIGHGADWIKVYADYRWGGNGQAAPTFSLDELKLIVETAASSGRNVVAHAGTAEGMRRAILAGIKTIEHGDGGTPEIFALMKEHGVALCPTLAAVESTSRYAGWKKGTDTEPERVKQKKASFKMAMDAGVLMCNGSDVGVFSHGENALELELMNEYGMSRLEVLKSATSRNAQILGLNKLGQVASGFWADLIAVEGNPLNDFGALRRIKMVMKDGVFYKQPTK